MDETSGGPIGFVKTFAEWCAAALEVVGCAIILFLALYALGRAAAHLLRARPPKEIFRETRRILIRSILLGLEFLVAADIVHTVAVDLTFTSVGVLAIVVVVRTFLSFVLELEMTGRWPWQKDHQPGEGSA